jgi:hypothetical protein
VCTMPLGICCSAVFSPSGAAVALGIPTQQADEPSELLSSTTRTPGPRTIHTHKNESRMLSWRHPLAQYQLITKPPLHHHCQYHSRKC